MDYAAWQRGLQGAVLEKGGALARQARGGRSGAELPFAPHPGRRCAATAERRGFSCCPRSWRERRPAEPREECPCFMTLLTAFLALLGAHQEAGPVIGYRWPTATASDIEGLIGFFLNTLVLRVDLSGDPRPGSLLGRVPRRGPGSPEPCQLPFETWSRSCAGAQPQLQPSVPGPVRVAEPPASELLPGLIRSHPFLDWRHAQFDLSCGFEKSGVHPCSAAWSTAAPCSKKRDDRALGVISPASGRIVRDPDKRLQISAAAARRNGSRSSEGSGTTCGRARRFLLLHLLICGAAARARGARSGAGGLHPHRGELETAGEPAGPPPAAQGSQDRRPGGRLLRTLTGDGGDPARGLEGRRRLGTPGSRLSRRAPGRRAGRRPAGPPDHCTGRSTGAAGGAAGGRISLSSPRILRMSQGGDEPAADPVPESPSRRTTSPTDLSSAPAAQGVLSPTSHRQNISMHRLPRGKATPVLQKPFRLRRGD